MSLVPSANESIGDLEAPYALIFSPARYIGTLVPHVTVREIHIDEDTITVFPVETGTPVSDHVFANPKLIEIQCGFSDSTVGIAGFSQIVYQAFLALKATREPFNVSTGKRLYQNMLFGSITVVTDEASENTLMVSARLQEVIISQTSASSAGNQANPQQTSPESDVGTQTLQSAPNAALYQDYENSFGPGG